MVFLIKVILYFCFDENLCLDVKFSNILFREVFIYVFYFRKSIIRRMVNGIFLFRIDCDKMYYYLEK